MPTRLLRGLPRLRFLGFGFGLFLRFDLLAEFLHERVQFGVGDVSMQ